MYDTYMHIVTAGYAYADIDAYAGCVAYAELLQAEGQEAVAVSTAPLNESISRSVRSWQAPFATEYHPNAKDTFSLIDLSDPKHFDRFVDVERIDAIIDHHPGFEQYWQERIGDKAQIEAVGAACTQVFERWQTSGLLGKMSVTSARLLVCGILDNTLNFGAKITDDRDHHAYDTLMAKAELPQDWPAQYFGECQEEILNDMSTAIQNDSKTLTFKSFEEPIAVGQLTVWDGKLVMDRHHSTIQTSLANMEPNWFMNLISLGDRTSYFISDNPAVQQWLGKLLNVEFDGQVAAADRLWLRKEIIQQDISHS